MTELPPTENQKFRISRVLIGAPYIIHQPDNLLIPVCDCRVIVENGGIYQRTLLAFGLNKERVIQSWDAEHEKFHKINPNPDPNPSPSPAPNSDPLP